MLGRSDTPLLKRRDVIAQLRDRSSRVRSPLWRFKPQYDVTPTLYSPHISSCQQSRFVVK